MKKRFFIVLFIIFTLFPVHLVYKDEASNNIILNSSAKTIDVSSEYKLLVDRSNNTIVVYKNNKNLKEIKFQGSLDKNINSTVESKGVLAFNVDNSCKQHYYIEIYPNYTISSIPIDEKGTIIEDGKNIIISEEEIKWIYDNIPVDTGINEK